MTKDKFIELLKTEAGNFSRYWAIMQDQEGEHDWPEELDSLDDWLEQFLMWWEDDENEE